MSKTNFTKVEKAVDDGLQQIIVNHLLELADEANSNKNSTTPLSHDQRTALLQTLNRNLKQLNKSDPAAYKKLSPLKTELKRLLTISAEFTPEDWKKVKEIKDKIELYRKEMLKNLPHQSNDEIVEQERLKHINKRFNINDGWLPLK